MIYGYPKIAIFNFRLKHLHSTIVGVFFLLLSVYGCVEEHEVQNDPKQITEFKKQLPSVNFSSKVFRAKVISKEPHFFSSKIAFKEAHVYIKKEEKDIYTFLWIVDAMHTDFEELKKWKLGMIIKPKNPADFNDKDLVRKGIKTMGVLTKPFLLDNQVCIILRDFKVTPKNIDYIKFYLYNDLKQTNLKYWITKDLSLP